MFKQKKFMAYLVTVFLLIVSMLIAACGGPSETKKDTAYGNAQKTSGESCFTMEWRWWSILYDFRTYGQGYTEGYCWHGYILTGL